jgi:hypothetical protein
VACQAAKAGIRFTKEGNCFTQISDAAGLVLTFEITVTYFLKLPERAV